MERDDINSYKVKKGGREAVVIKRNASIHGGTEQPVPPKRERGSGNEKQKTGMMKKTTGTGTSTYTHPREAITLISAERKERAPLVDSRERENYLTHS